MSSLVTGLGSIGAIGGLPKLPPLSLRKGGRLQRRTSNAFIR